MPEGPKTPLPDNIFRKMEASSNVHDLETGKPLTNREVAAEARAYKASQPQRQVGRRFIDTTIGKFATGIGIIATAVGLGTAVKGTLDVKNAEQEFSQRSVAASGIEPGKTIIESETKKSGKHSRYVYPGQNIF